MKLPSLLTSLLVMVALVVGLHVLPFPEVQAAIENPAIGALGENTAATDSGVQFIGYFVSIWRALTIVGALAVIIYFVWGAVDWIVAGGEAGKIGKARDKMTQAVIGLIILVSSFVIIGFLGQLFFGSNFDLLRLDITGLGTTTGTSGIGTGTGTGGTTNGGGVQSNGVARDGQCVVKASDCRSGMAYPNPSECLGARTLMCGSPNDNNNGGVPPIAPEDRPNTI